MPIHSQFSAQIWTLLLLLQSTPMVFLVFPTRFASLHSQKFQFWTLTFTRVLPTLTTEYLLPPLQRSLTTGAMSRPIRHQSAPPSCPP